MWIGGMTPSSLSEGVMDGSSRLSFCGATAQLELTPLHFEVQYHTQLHAHTHKI